MKRLAIALTMTGFLSNANAIEGCYTTAADNVTNVYFANGIDNTEDQARISRNLLKLHLQTPLAESAAADDRFIFLNAYNRTQGRYNDLLEVFQQKAEELQIVEDGFHINTLYEWVVAGLSNDEIRAAVTVLLTRGNRNIILASLTDDALLSLRDSVAKSHANALTEHTATNLSHIGYYGADLRAGKRVLIVAHSQGNLYTTSAVAQVRLQQPENAHAITYYGVASPSNQLQPFSDYVTADDDRVINALRIVEDVLPGNLDNDPGVFNDHRDFANHNFNKGYLDSRLASYNVIIKGAVALVSQLDYPLVQAGQGALRATLSWNGISDVDLHVFEPSGSHVYYSNYQGEDGFLDLDNTYGYGPENYFVGCNNIKPGIYSIGVNYYSGRTPQTATVALYLGDGRTPAPKQIVLETSQGRAGDSNPTILFNVTVTEGTDGKAVYSLD